MTMISSIGELVWVFEIGTSKAAKFSQLEDRLVWWQHCLTTRMIHALVQAGRWRPARGVIGEIGRYSICTEPTWRELAPHGVLLYEIHEAKRDSVRVPHRQEVLALSRQPKPLSTFQLSYPDVHAETKRRGIPSELVVAVILVALGVLTFGGATIAEAVAVAIALVVHERRSAPSALAHIGIT
jgi:hypothetical protein